MPTRDSLHQIVPLGMTRSAWISLPVPPKIINKGSASAIVHSITIGLTIRRQQRQQRLPPSFRAETVLIIQYQLHKIQFERVERFVQNRMKIAVVLRTADVDLFRLFLAALDNFEKCDEGFTLIVVEVKRGGVGYPTVDTTTAGVDPEEVFEAEGFWGEPSPLPTAGRQRRGSQKGIFFR